jgi:hypothetical protein
VRRNESRTHHRDTGKRVWQNFLASRKTSPPGPLSVPERGPGGEVFINLQPSQNSRPPEIFARPQRHREDKKREKIDLKVVSSLLVFSVSLW